MERSGNSSQAPKAYTHSATRHNGTNGTNGTNGHPTSTPRTAARHAALDPSMPSFLPSNDSHAYKGQTQESLASELARIERNVMSYNTAHQMEIIQFEDNTSKNSADISDLTNSLNSLKSDFNNKLNDLNGLKTDFTNDINHVKNIINNNLSDLKSEVTNFHEQTNQNSGDLDDMRIILSKDFRTVNSQIAASDAAMQEMNARVVAAEEERRITRILMLNRTLAEAESYELQAKRLRESVRALQGPPAMLQLSAAPSHEEETADAPAETVAHTQTPAVSREPATVATSSTNTGNTSEPTALTAPTEQTSNETGASTSATPASTKWQPQAVAGLAPLNVSYPNTTTFTWEELHRHLGGAQYSPGLYFTCNNAEDRVLKGRSYWLLEAQYEPFAPTVPGHHGAKLTAFFNDNLAESGEVVGEEDYADVPVFVCLDGSQDYTYVGQYSQRRFSDKLSHSELFQRLPTQVLRYWASVLADPHRPAWVTEQLIAHFWPAPTYAGPIPSDSAVTTPATGVSEPRDPEHVLEKRVVRALEKFAGELKDWEKASRIKANLLSEEALMEMWAKSDLDAEKGLRLWWEYLECVGFDEDFYGKLVALKGGKTNKGKAAVRDPETSQKSGNSPGPSGGKHKGLSKDTDSKTRGSQGIPQVRGSIESNETLKPLTYKQTKRPAGLMIDASKAAEDVEGPIVQAMRGEQNDGGQPETAAANATRANLFANADLEAARRMHEKATKASPKKPRGGRAAKDIKW